MISAGSPGTRMRPSWSRRSAMPGWRSQPRATGRHVSRWRCRRGRRRRPGASRAPRVLACWSTSGTCSRGGRAPAATIRSGGCASASFACHGRSEATRHAGAISVDSATSPCTPTRSGCPARCRGVPYCYDSSRFVPTPRLREAVPTLLTVSRLQPFKNQGAVIRAAARLGRDVQVRFIGRGPEEAALEVLARRLGVRCRVETTADDAAVTRAYREASVAVALEGLLVHLRRSD